MAPTWKKETILALMLVTRLEVMFWKPNSCSNEVNVTLVPMKEDVYPIMNEARDAVAAEI